MEQTSNLSYRGNNKRFQLGVASFLWGALGALAAILVTAVAGYLLLDTSFLQSSSCASGERYVICFFDEVWDSSSYLSLVTGFYSTVITLLIGLLGVTAAFAFFAIRGSAFQQAEEAMEREVARFFATEKANRTIREGLKALVAEDINKLSDRLDEILAALYDQGFLDPGVLEVEDAEKAKEAD